MKISTYIGILIILNILMIIIGIAMSESIVVFIFSFILGFCLYQFIQEIENEKSKEKLKG